MALTASDVYDRIDGLHLDELDLLITKNGAGFSVTDNRSDGSAEDIGSSFEVPDSVDEHGRVAFSAGPWTAYQYHGSYAAPRRDNYTREVEDLSAGDVAAVIVGVTAISETNTWVFAIRTVEN
ncbi:hypothetical protein [Mycolicibacterium goodii]|uniref:hypothetical protein n=1 Tax=Mycolicibacterium goodii TaxID=134601 RepID=UPI001BDD52F7|nr:hypothetical protein [Mycolicibacterium goodii]MBU8840181.1 hypothetical protein [Mycolicibacterium goodii]